MQTLKMDKQFEQFIKPQAFEQFIGALLESLGYSVEYQKKVKDTFFDMKITSIYNKSETYICEIKYYSKPKFSPSKDVYAIIELSNILEPEQKGLFITTSICTPQCREAALEKNIIILDITNLVYLVNPNHELYQHFLELIDFSIAKFEPVEPIIPFSLKQDKIKKERPQLIWTKKFENIKPGQKDFTEYENLCVEALKLLFSDFLSIWEQQQNSNDNIYRFDLICKIKNDISDDFFETLNTYFNTRYIVFDFKNYSEQITQKEIYTTEKYLYDKALRKVAIIVSRNGIDENALKAVKGSLREQGKVILTLTDYDILEMINMYYKGDNPTDYLSMKLDKLLIELEK